MEERFLEEESLYEMRREARDRIMNVVQKLSGSENLVINIGEETPDTITLSLRVIDPNSKKSKTYRKGFMKILKFPDGLSVEEEVEKQIRFPEEEA